MNHSWKQWYEYFMIRQSERDALFSNCELRMRAKYEQDWDIFFSEKLNEGTHTRRRKETLENYYFSHVFIETIVSYGADSGVGENKINDPQ